MDKLLTAKEVAELLHCHPQSVYRNEELPFSLMPGIGKRYEISDIKKYIENNTVKPSPSISQLLYNQHFSLTKPPENDNIKSSNLGGISEMAKTKSKARYNFGYGAIYQRKTKNGKIRWYLDYRDGNGKRIQKVAPLATTKEEAALALKDEMAKTFNKEYGIKQNKEDIGFCDFAELYIRDYAMVRKKSWKSDYYYLYANMIPYFEDSLLSELTQVKIEKYVVKRVKDGVQKSSINRELACLRKLFNKAIDWGYVEESPMLKVRLFSEKNNIKERVLTDEEEKKLLASSSDHLKPIINTAIKTGMRKSEILGLSWSNVDFQKREIKVENSKSGRTRVIPINVDLLKDLERMKKSDEKYDWVFVNPDTGRPFKDVKRAFQGACRRAGIKGLRFHDLRHTFASRLVERGVDLITVKDLLGHGSVRVTERYTHSNSKLKKAAVDVLSENPGERAKKKVDLLPICDTKEKGQKANSVKTLFSIN